MEVDLIGLSVNPLLQTSPEKESHFVTENHPGVKLALGIDLKAVFLEVQTPEVEFDFVNGEEEVQVAG